MSPYLPQDPRNLRAADRSLSELSVPPNSELSVPPKGIASNIMGIAVLTCAFVIGAIQRAEVQNGASQPASPTSGRNESAPRSPVSQDGLKGLGREAGKGVSDQPQQLRQATDPSSPAGFSLVPPQSAPSFTIVRKQPKAWRGDDLAQLCAPSCSIEQVQATQQRLRALQGKAQAILAKEAEARQGDSKPAEAGLLALRKALAQEFTQTTKSIHEELGSDLARSDSMRWFDQSMAKRHSIEQGKRLPEASVRAKYGTPTDLMLKLVKEMTGKDLAPHVTIKTMKELDRPYNVEASSRTILLKEANFYDTFDALKAATGEILAELNKDNGNNSLKVRLLFAAAVSDHIRENYPDLPAYGSREHPLAEFDIYNSVSSHALRSLPVYNTSLELLSASSSSADAFNFALAGGKSPPKMLECAKSTQKTLETLIELRKLSETIADTRALVGKALNEKPANQRAKPNDKLWVDLRFQPVSESF